MQKAGLNRMSNKSMEPTGASGSGQLQSLRQWPLAPAAHAQRWPF
jgi:hypothetical protein